MKRTAWRLLLLGLLALAAAAPVAAHPQLLFAHISTRPPQAPADEELEFRLFLSDSARREMPGLEMELRIFEESVDPAEIAAIGPEEETGQPLLARVPLAEDGDDGVYEGVLPALEAGSYPFRLVELVDGEVESNASGVLPIGTGDTVDMELILPPVAAGVGTWLIWLVGLPLLAGVLVTILVLTGKGPRAASE